MDILIGLAPILFFIIVLTIIIGAVVRIFRTSVNSDSKRRIKELEEENEKLRKNNKV